MVMRRAANPGDVALIELLGVMAAALAAAVALRNIKGTSSPYSLPIALAVLKLPTGALTAVLAIILMRGEFVPGLSALDSSAQILAWAIVFGYAQQILTQLVDRQAHTVLDNVRSGGTAPAMGSAAATPTNPA
jgi:CBS domain containing-hemolysin-like protein